MRCPNCDDGTLQLVEGVRVCDACDYTEDRGEQACPACEQAECKPHLSCEADADADVPMDIDCGERTQDPCVLAHPCRKHETARFGDLAL